MPSIARNIQLYANLAALILAAIFIDIPAYVYHLIFIRQPKNVSGKVVVITGAGRGLGYQMAELMCIREKAKVAMVDFDQNLNKVSCSKLNAAGGEAYAFAADVRNSVSVKNVAKQIRQHPNLGEPDIVICNAGVLLVKDLTDSKDEDLKRTFDVNVLGVCWTIRAFLSEMINRNDGHIVAIGSAASFIGQRMSPDYCASKFAVRGLMESIREELREKGRMGVQLTTIYPYFIQTSMIKDCNIKSKYDDVLTVEEAGAHAVEAILCQDLEYWIPTKLKLLLSVAISILPRRSLDRLRKMTDVHYK